MPNFETGDSRESVANPSHLIDSIRSLVKFAPVLAALLAVSACNKGDNDPDSQAKLRACQIDSAKLEGILSGLNVDRAKLEGDSDSFGGSDGEGRLHACEVRKAKLIGLSQGAEIDRRQFKLKLKAVGLGELVLDVPCDDEKPAAPSAGEKTRTEDTEKRRVDQLEESRSAEDDLENPWDAPSSGPAPQAQPAPAPNAGQPAAPGGSIQNDIDSLPQ